MACSASSSLAGCTGSAERSAACCNRHDRACLALRIFATNRRLLSASLGLLLLPPGRKTILPQEDVQGKIRHAADLEKSSDCERTTLKCSPRRSLPVGAFPKTPKRTGIRFSPYYCTERRRRERSFPRRRSPKPLYMYRNFGKASKQANLSCSVVVEARAARAQVRVTYCTELPVSCTERYSAGTVCVPAPPGVFEPVGITWYVRAVPRRTAMFPLHRRCAKNSRSSDSEAGLPKDVHPPRPPRAICAI